MIFQGLLKQRIGGRIMEKFEAVLSILGLDTKPTNASEAYEVFRKVKEVESIIEKG